MDTTAATAETSATEAPAASGSQSVECLIHVRFNLDGTIKEIGECPKGISTQTWFNYLSGNTLNCYQALAGGRGLFRVPRAQVDSLKVACASGSAA